MSLLAAVAFLTTLPLPARWRTEPRQLARSVRWFPLVGLAIGLLLAGFDALIGLVTAGPVRDALLIVAILVLTGGLHLDGLMDTCDGVFAPVPPARRLEIMRDSHVGSFGVAAAGVALLGRYAALASLGTAPRWAALVLMAVLGRWAMALAITSFQAGRPEGLGRLVKDATTPVDIAIAALVAVAACTGCLQLAGLIVFAGVSLLAWLLARAIAAALPGLTGDTYGALNELAEVGALVLIPVCLRLV